MVELNRPGGAAQLQDGLVQHQESRGTDRMSAGDQSSGDVHRDLSVPGRRAGGSDRASCALLTESEVLHEVDLGKGGGVVELHEVEVLRRAAGHRVSSEEHTSELQSLMRSEYAAFCSQTKPNRSVEQHYTTA